MAKVSIIVPVYQVEKYIRQCIDSILNQTFRDFELILVDDGSRDNSGAICDEYARIDSRVRVIHKQNGGLSDARNHGLDDAVGEYFLFVDSDDFIAPTMVEKLYGSILKENADIAICNFRYCFEQDERRDFNTNAGAEVLRGAEVFYNRKNERSYGIWTVAWNKLYKRDTFRDVRFRLGKYHEDEFWANDIYRKNIKVLTIPECLYFYRQRSGSIMSCENIDRQFDILEALQERIQVYLESQAYSEQAYKVLIFSLEYLAKSKKLAVSQREKDRYLVEERKTKEIVRQLENRELPYLKKISLPFLRMNPCIVFEIGMRLRGLLEKFL